MSKNLVILTGSSGGIGNSICRLLKKEGYFVIGIDVKEPPDNTIDEFINFPLQDLINSDAAQESFYNKVMKLSINRKFSGIVNNAAIQELGSLDNLNFNDFKKSLDINVSIPFILAKIFSNNLEKNSGSIVNIGSIHAVLTKPGFIAYATSKAALEGLTKSLAVDLGERGIRVNLIRPAATNTKMLKEGFIGKKEEFSALEKYHPLMRIAEPIEIAEAVLFLLSGKSSFTTGSVLEISGGIGSRLHDPV